MHPSAPAVKTGRAVVVVAHRADTVARWGEVAVVEDAGVRPLSPEPARRR